MRGRQVLGMYIKRRLFISNILMIVIPVVLSLLISMIGMIITWSVYFPGLNIRNANVRQMYDERTNIATLAKEMVATSDASARKAAENSLALALNRNSMRLWIVSDGQRLSDLGSYSSPNTDKLEAAITALGGAGAAIAGNDELYAEPFLNAGSSATLYILGFKLTPEVIVDRNAFVIYGILVSLAIIAFVFITNRFLIRFVFSKIEQPLGILTQGVHQVRDGNLDFRIQYRNNDEFATICDDFNVMADHLQESTALVSKQEQSRKELLAGISHDLRSPLTSIKAYAEGLLDGVARTPAAQQKYTQMIKAKAEEIDRMVAKLSHFSRMDVGEYPYFPEVIELGEEIRSFVEAISEEYASRGLLIQITQLETETPVLADPVLLHNVFANILENSLKYKDQAMGRVQISSHRQGDKVCIQLQDDGPGVPDNELEKIFEVFYRCDPSRNNPNSGSGLGLAISAKTIERMNGQILAENIQPKGLCISIQLPIYQPINRSI